MSAVAPRAQRSSERRTITGIGLFLLEAIPLGLVGFILAWITDGLGIVFQLVFIGLAAYGALRVRRRDLLAAFIVPPLAYAAAIVIASPALGITGGLIVGLATNVGSFLAVGAPWLFLGTAIAFGIAVWRGRTGR